MCGGASTLLHATVPPAQNASSGQATFWLHNHPAILERLRAGAHLKNGVETAKAAGIASCTPHTHTRARACAQGIHRSHICVICRILCARRLHAIPGNYVTTASATGTATTTLSEEKKRCLRYVHHADNFRAKPSAPVRHHLGPKLSPSTC